MAIGSFSAAARAVVASGGYDKDAGSADGIHCRLQRGGVTALVFLWAPPGVVEHIRRAQRVAVTQRVAAERGTAPA